VTSVSKIPQKVGDAPAAIFVLTNEDIKRSGATVIPEALRLVPGVNVARINTSGWAISIRGFNGALANKLLVLIDGREVYDHLFSGVYWDVQDIPLEDVERIEVIRGPGATLWGANAVNGVINIITRDSSATVGGRITSAAGNKERAYTSARYGGSIGDNGHYRVYGKYTDRGEEKTLAGTDANDDWTQYRAGFRTDWNVSADKITVQGDLYNSEVNQFHTVPTLAGPPFSFIAPENITARGGNLLSRWTRGYDGGAQLQLQAYFDYTYRDQLTLKDRRVSADIDTQYVFPQTSRHQLIAGGRYRYSHSDLTPSALITTPRPQRDENLFSAFVQDKITLKDDKWYLTLGSKIEHNDYTGVEIQPNARLQWHPDSHNMVWASAARAVRTPSRLEHDTQIFSGVVTPFGPAIPIVVRLDPSPNFESEVLIAYELGYRNQINPSTSLDVAAFYNDYSKLSTLTLQAPILAPPPITLPILFTNDTKGGVYGLETTFNWKASSTLNFSASHSLLDMELHGPPAALAIAAEGAEFQSPTSQFVLRTQWDITDTVDADGIVYHTSPLRGFAVDDYWRLDARLGWKPNDSLEFDLVGQNLLGPARHREFTPPTEGNATTIGRSVYGRATWRF
ncbi:MAG: TonB-dependent receptor plug domain-containing protein, partial [Alphaproteobacteria bacterium]